MNPQYTSYKHYYYKHDCYKHKHKPYYSLFLTATVVEMDPTAPGPHDLSVLHMQDTHRSSLLWDAYVSLFDA